MYTEDRQGNLNPYSAMLISVPTMEAYCTGTETVSRRYSRQPHQRVVVVSTPGSRQVPSTVRERSSNDRET